MAKKRVTSRPGLFGYIYHYDEKGKCIGKNRPSLMGEGKVHYDAEGKQVGTSRPGFLAKEVYHDDENDRYISSYEGLTGDVYFENGTPVGSSRPGFGGTEYTTLDMDEITDNNDCENEEYYEENAEPIQQYGNEQKSVITNVVLFVACCLFVGILALIFMK